MKRTYCIYLLFFFLVGLSFSNAGYAQQHNEPTVLSGHFEIDTTVAEVTNHVNVNFALFPIPVGSSTTFQINTAQNMLFNVDLKDTTGAIISSWTPTAISNMYTHVFNTTLLAAGTYMLAIRKYNETTVLYTVSFTKG